MKKQKITFIHCKGISHKGTTIEIIATDLILASRIALWHINQNKPLAERKTDKDYLISLFQVSPSL